MSVIQDDSEDSMTIVDLAHRCRGTKGRSAMALETDAFNDTRQKSMDLDYQEQRKAVTMQVKPGR